MDFDKFIALLDDDRAMLELIDGEFDKETELKCNLLYLYLKFLNKDISAELQDRFDLHVYEDIEENPRRFVNYMIKHYSCTRFGTHQIYCQKLSGWGHLAQMFLETFEEYLVKDISPKKKYKLIETFTTTSKKYYKTRINELYRKYVTMNVLEEYIHEGNHNINLSAVQIQKFQAGDCKIYYLLNDKSLKTIFDWYYTAGKGYQAELNEEDWYNVEIKEYTKPKMNYI